MSSFMRPYAAALDDLAALTGPDLYPEIMAGALAKRNAERRLDRFLGRQRDRQPIDAGYVEIDRRIRAGLAAVRADLAAPCPVSTPEGLVWVNPTTRPENDGDRL